MKMRTRSQLLSLGLACAMALSLLHAQTAPTGSSAAQATSVPPAQAPDEMTKKITDLVHAGKYADAQQLTNGLLIAYPDDQRLIKARALIEKMLASGGSTGTAPAKSEPAQPAAIANVEQLTGMDKVDYNALIALAHQAQQTTDLAEQMKLLRQYMAQSTPFLQKHPDLTLLWQFRAVSAIILNEPNLGYEAGQRLLDAGAARSNDPALQNLPAQLRNKGWLDEQLLKNLGKYDWVLGTWSVTCTYLDLNKQGAAAQLHGAYSNVEFSRPVSDIEGYSFNSKHAKFADPVYRAVILDSGELRWEWRANLPHAASPWLPAISFQRDEEKQTMTIVFASPNKDYGPQTLLFTRTD